MQDNWAYRMFVEMFLQQHAQLIDVRYYPIEGTHALAHIILFRLSPRVA